MLKVKCPRHNCPMNPECWLCNDEKKTDKRRMVREATKLHARNVKRTNLKTLKGDS